jgi:hypothetical protein
MVDKVPSAIGVLAEHPRYLIVFWKYYHPVSYPKKPIVKPLLHNIMPIVFFTPHLVLAYQETLQKSVWCRTVYPAAEQRDYRTLFRETHRSAQAAWTRVDK